MIRRFLFRWRLRRERRWRAFLASTMPAPQPEPSPDCAAAALQGAASLIQAFTSAETERIKATAEDRQREFEQRQADREAARAARRAAAEKRRDIRSGRLLSHSHGAMPGACRVCRGDATISTEDVKRHYEEAHPNPHAMN